MGECIPLYEVRLSVFIRGILSGFALGMTA